MAAGVVRPCCRRRPCRRFGAGGDRILFRWKPCLAGRQRTARRRRRRLLRRADPRVDGSGADGAHDAALRRPRPRDSARPRRRHPPSASSGAGPRVRRRSTRVQLRRPRFVHAIWAAMALGRTLETSSSPVASDLATSANRPADRPHERRADGCVHGAQGGGPEEHGPRTAITPTSTPQTNAPAARITATVRAVVPPARDHADDRAEQQHRRNHVEVSRRAVVQPRPRRRRRWPRPGRGPPRRGSPVGCG